MHCRLRVGRFPFGAPLIWSKENGPPKSKSGSPCLHNVCSAHKIRERRELVPSLRNRRTQNLNAAQVAAAHTKMFSKAQGAVAGLKRWSAAVRHRIESHHGCGNGIG